MNRFLKNIEGKKLAFKISLFYVFLGTLSVCSVYPKDIFYGEWALFGLIVTFPVSIMSFAYRYAESDFLYPVFIIQFIMYFLTFYILGLIIKDKKNV